MVTLEAVHSSNTRITTTLPPYLVAIFIGTSNIGETTILQFAKHASRPFIYIFDRAQEAGTRIVAACETLNPKGFFRFIEKDISVMRNVDVICEEIWRSNKKINLLFLTCGTLMTGIKTAEGLHHPAALTIYAQNRFIQNLLPLLRRAESLRRVVTTFAGTHEGDIRMHDFQGCNLGSLGLRAHVAAITTLALEHHKTSAPEVSFIHNDAGADGETGSVTGMPSPVFPAMDHPPLDEIGARNPFLATSARYAASTRDPTAGVLLLDEGIEVARGVDGKVGSGVYSIDASGESAGPDVERVLMELRNNGLVKAVWQRIEEDITLALTTGKVSTATLLDKDTS